MPIILISVDVENTLEDFKNMLNKVDLIMESTDNRSNQISNIISNYTTILNRIQMETLDVATENESLQDIRIRFQSVLNVIRNMNVANAIIISHTNVINAWQPDTIRNNWEILEM